MKSKDETELEDGKTEIYEIGFHLSSVISGEDVPQAFGEIKAIIEKNGGSFISEDFPKSRSLAYPILHVLKGARARFENAYFGWIKFQVNASRVKEIKDGVSTLENVIRFLIIKTVRENTMHIIRTIRRSDEKRERKAEVPKGPVNEAELDKQIEELVKE